jgi:recombination protein RecT
VSADASKAAIARTRSGQVEPMAAGMTPLRELAARVESQAAAFARVMPPGLVAPDQWMGAALRVLRRPGIIECPPETVLGALMSAAQLGLMPNSPLGHCAIVPQREKTGGPKVAQLRIEYRGWVNLALRSGQITSLIARIVYEHDEFDVLLGTEERIHHRPLLTGDRGSAFAWYATARTRDGDPTFVVLSRADAEAAKASSPQGRRNEGPWRDHFDAMARKTAILRLAPYLPVTPDFGAALAADERVRTDLSPDVLAEPDVIDIPDEADTTWPDPAPIPATEVAQ